MRRRVWVAVVAGAAVGLAAGTAWWLRPPRAAAVPVPVPAGDQEVAWLHVPTSFETWDNFVRGAKRAEMAGPGPAGLEVDESGAYPEKTTAVPEVVIRRKGFAGALRVRWYKLTDEAPAEEWARALAARDPAPLAVLGGWTSDRARTLADAMKGTPWPGPRPLLFLATATAEQVHPADNVPPAGQGTPLIKVYDRAFRFCFTNSQMAEAVTEFVLSDPDLRPGPVAGTAAGDVDPIGGHAIEWLDDPYSTDLSDKFRRAFAGRTGPGTGLPLLLLHSRPVPFSVGRLNRPNRAEAETAEDVLRHLPPPGYRTVLVIPTVSAPARRTLRTLVQGKPDVGRQLVAVTGDGMSVNTFFRDGEFAWPVRSLPVPLVLFTHANPFGWDRPETGPAPPGYELPKPAPGEVRSSTEDVGLFNRLVRVACAAAFPDGAAALVDGPDALEYRLRNPAGPPLFDPAGDRLSGTGEHVVVLRPGPADPRLVVYCRSGDPKRGEWKQVGDPVPLGRPTGGSP